VSFLAVLSISMVGIAGTAQYLELLEWIDRTHYTINPLAMPNFRGLISALVGVRFPDLVGPLTAVLSLSLIVYIVRLWRGVSVQNEKVFDWTIALTLTLTSIISYHAYTHDFTLLLIPALIATRGVLSGTARGIQPLLLFAVLLILWMPHPIIFGRLLEMEKLAWAALLLLVFAVLLAIQLKISRGEA